MKPMNGHNRPPRSQMLICAAALLLSSALLSACRDTNPYTNHRDTIRLGAGDAVAHNRAVQTIDPWPVYSKNTDIPVDGKRMMVGVERYQTNQSLEPRGGDTTDRFAKDDSPNGPPPAGPPGAPAP